MPVPGTITKATLQEIRWDKAGQPELKDAGGAKTDPVPVQFNPQTLKVNFANQKAGGDQPKGSAVQFVGKGTTKLTCELVFDVTVLETGTGRPKITDVRVLTGQVSRFMLPKQVKGSGGGKGKEPNFVPPGVRFSWGNFEFDGTMDSVDETLELFSEQGTPLRATVAISISKQELKVPPNRDSSPYQTPPAGVTPMATSAAGDSVAKIAGPNYKSVAAANGIENPRLLAPGTLLDLSGSAGLSASLGLGGGLEVPISASFGVSAGAGVAVTGGSALEIAFSAGAEIGGGLGLSAGAGAGIGIGASGGAALGLSAGASAGGSAQIGAETGVSADASASAEASFR
jgi:hypothetical protein